MPVKNIIYIIGFMGSGKSTAGRKLAASMGWSFVDLDRKIEEVSLKTIPKIFSEDGEVHFRKIESEVLESLGNNKNTVISTGGGKCRHGSTTSVEGTFRAARPLLPRGSARGARWRFASASAIAAVDARQPVLESISN